MEGDCSSPLVARARGLHKFTGAARLRSTQAIGIVQELRTRSRSKQGDVVMMAGTDVEDRGRNFRLTSSALCAFWSMFNSVNG